MNSEYIYIHPYRLERVMFQALEEILGLQVVQALINPAPRSISDNQTAHFFPGFDFSFCNLILVQTILEEKYGTLAGRGVSQRVGRACFKYCLREFGTELAITGSGFRLLPLPTRLKAGSEILAGLFTRLSSQSIHLEVDKKQVLWHIERKSPELKGCGGGISCALVKGFIQEAWNWMSGGKFFLVEEMNCAARGDSRCTLVVNQTPLI